MKAVLLLSFLAVVIAVPSPVPCPSCRRGHSIIAAPPVYRSRPAYYAPPVYGAPVYTQSAPVYSLPAVQETIVSHQAPVVQETVVSQPAPVVEHRQPYVIGSYTTTSVGAPEYIPVKTTIHKQEAIKYHITYPVEYNYEVERPVHHTTTVYSHAYKPPVYSAHSYNSVNNVYDEYSSGSW